MARKRKMTEKTPRPEDVKLDAAVEGTSDPGVSASGSDLVVGPDVAAGLGNEPGVGTQADTGELERERQHEPLTAAQTEGIDDTEEIAQRAYERFLARGGEHGRDQEDWYEAEQSVRGSTPKGR